ncbi:MAG: CoA-binding protein [Desulfuromonadales bacterium]|nr:CoA-binding protein [Desulfuromonadales bacterium]MBN2793620.1 CoA-binding protein [Desulfuromonadales bacterium]
MTVDQQIEEFLAAPAFAVVGASVNRDKYGNKVLRCYQQNKRQVIPVHPSESEIEGLQCVAGVADLPDDVASLSIITPPQITEKVVEQAAAKGIKNIWMQPGAESPAAVQFCQDQGLNVIADGSCLLVVLHYHEH